EDKPAQTIVEIIDLEKIDTPTVDATIPVVINRNATTDNFIARDLTLAHGAVQVAGGKQGINRIELSQLVVADHTPATAEMDVVTDLANIDIELSAVLAPDVDLAQYLRVYRGN